MTPPANPSKRIAFHVGIGYCFSVKIQGLAEGNRMPEGVRVARQEHIRQMKRMGQPSRDRK